MKRILVSAMCCSLVLACGGKQKTEEVAPPAAPPPLEVDGNARLTDDVKPTAYRIDLTIDPAKEKTVGAVEIDIEVAKPTSALLLHGEEMEIQSATLTSAEAKHDLKPTMGENGGLGLESASEIPAGTYTLQMSFEALLDEVPTGLYRVKEGDAWYAFTQFEPLEARQAFPSFDEPKFKTPYEVTLRVPAGQLAFSNTPETSRETVDELEVFTFAKSKPMPTYLVAFAVGPLEVLDAGDIDGIAFRILTAKGKSHLGKYMAERTPLLLKSLTEYFGQPYPYEKLDVVAVPNFSSGAMENVGLVTFRERLLLIDSENGSLRAKRSANSVMAHELAHMWFGNLVTMSWWAEIWLNEGFATWMAAKVVEDVMPELESSIDNVNRLGWVIGADSRAESTPVRQKIAHGGDVYNAFGAIAYQKGAAILRLFEAWVGEDAMREGVRAYIKAHEHGTGTTEDLLTALEAASGKPVTEAMSTFLDQPGAPLLTTKIVCEDESVSVAVEQSRYLPAGSNAAKTGPWKVPVCIGWPDAKGKMQQHCELVADAAATVAIPTKSCPDWYYPNAGQVGYYRWNTDAENLVKLLNKKTFNGFDVATRVDIHTNLRSLSNAELVDAGAYLNAVQSVATQEHRTLVYQLLNGLNGVWDAAPDERKPDVSKKAQALLRKHVKRVGLDPKAKDSPEIAQLRPTLLRSAAYLAKDPTVLQWASKTADRFMKNMADVHPDSASVAVPISAWDADASKWLSYKLAVTTAETPASRLALVSALGSVRDPKLLRKSLDLFFTDAVRSQDLGTLAGPSFATPQTHAVTWQWFTENYDKIVEAIGEKRAPRLPWVGGGFCDAEGRAKVKAFFEDPARHRPGLQRNLANTLEGIDQCIRRREYLRQGLDDFLE